ncbi:hypothetical protein CHS0354_016556 [Potamilus streckersoni]|uniref:Uncharacterized protein n=1 Tax=Potamilus streckersoni TaxID=2493646 RepID=A0AAE0TKP1_9BIVA|nr:hypothetical protein CHS0354_016556 [Potamilus streckersoni]
MQHFDVEKDVSICLEAARVLRKYSLCSEEKMVLNILRKAFKKTRKTYIKAYGQTEDRRRMYKEVLIRLESKTLSKEVLKQALIVKAKEAANRFVKALQLEQTAKVNMITVMKKYDSVSKRVAVRKVQYFLDTWRTQLALYIKHSFTSTDKCVGNPYLDAFVRVLGVNAHDAVEAMFECNKRIFTTLQVNRNTDIGVDVRKVLGFEPKVKSMTQKANDRESYLEYYGLPDSVFLPPGFKWHEVEQGTRQFQVTSSDLSTTLKQEVIVVHDHKAIGKHELTCKKGMVVNQLTDANELGLALGFYKRTFPFNKKKIGFFPVKCVSSEPRLVLKKSCRQY